MDRDIRILTLHKQYYLDSYEKPLNCLYTTWGYYDGIDIKKVEDKQYSKLFTKKSQAPISQLWYKTGEEIGKLCGRYGHQDIGLFRCVGKNNKKYRERATRFWNIQNKMPFFATVFLQLRDPRNYQKISESIEEKGNEEGDNLKKEKCGILTYCTYDNADLVLLLHSNSVWRMEKILRDIEKMDQVIYMHPIMGASEAYLQECKNAKYILNEWKGTKCFVDESVKRLSIQIVTSGAPEILPALKSVLDKTDETWHIKGYSTTVYSNMMGHESICLTIMNTDIRSMLALMVPEGFATHQNKVYEQGVYNIETSVFLREDNWENLKECELQIENAEEKAGMCRTLIKKYRNRLQQVRTEDESLYSYYQVLIQTLNTLDQYENFTMSRNIFRLLFPALAMFDEHLEIAETNTNINEYERKEQIKKSIKRFLDSANSVIYHTIHTDQIFLMVPGYSGTPFAIPIKLSLMYLWFIDKVSDLLNDGGYKYCCIMAPEMESRPRTNLIDFGLQKRDRLILVRLSQRSLFLPRDLMIILCHEIAHYISDKIRNRGKRLSCITLTLAYFIAECIFPEDYTGNTVSAEEEELFKIMKEEIKGGLQIDILKYLQQYNETCFGNKEVYANELYTNLYDAAWNYIGPEKCRAEEWIFAFSERMQKAAEKDEDDFVEKMRFIYNVQQYLNGNRKRMQGGKLLQKGIEAFIKMYREIFSDVAATAILDINDSDFKEAFQISEGRQITAENKPKEQILREKIISCILNGEKEIPEDKSRRTECIDTSEEKIVYLGIEQEAVMTDIYFYRWMQKYLLEYAWKAYEDLNERLKQKNEKDLKQIRRMFSMFKGIPEYGCREIYDRINEKIFEYTEKTEQSYSEWIKKHRNM